MSKKRTLIILTVIILCASLLLASCGNGKIKSPKYVDTLITAMDANNIELFDETIADERYSVDGSRESFLLRITKVVFLSYDTPYQALMEACRLENPYFVEKLLKRDANPNNPLGDLTPLQTAVDMRGRPEGLKNATKVVKLLLEYGADPNYMGAYKKEYQSPMHGIFKSQYNESYWHCNTQEIIELLLDYGYNKELKNSMGKTAYDIALANGYPFEITELIKP